MTDRVKDNNEDGRSNDDVDDEEKNDDRLCPFCGERCDEHVLGLFDEYTDDWSGIGVIGGPLYDVDEIGKVLACVRRHWLRTAPETPAWISDEPALYLYFSMLGSCLEFNPGDYAGDEEAADECFAYMSAHAGVARDCLETILERCGWRGENTRRERDDIPCMSTIYLTWWDPEPQERVERLRAELAAILAKATPR